MRLLQVVIKALNFVCVERFQFDRAECRLDMVLDVLRVVQHRHRLHAAQILPEPDIKPFADGHFEWFLVSPTIELYSRGLHLFSYLFLGFAREGPLDLPASAGIIPRRDAGFPIGVRLTATRDGLFSNRTRPLRGAGIFCSGHKTLLAVFSNNIIIKGEGSSLSFALST